MVLSVYRQDDGSCIVESDCVLDLTDRVSIWNSVQSNDRGYFLFGTMAYFSSAIQRRDLRL